MSRKLPIRTYQRKNIPNRVLKIQDSTRTDTISKYDNILKKQCGIDNIKENKISEDSLDCDPFETTFDRIAKDAVVPPIPLECIDNKSWYDSSFDTSNETKKQNESLFHVSITIPPIINPDIKCINSCEKKYDNKTKKKKKTYNRKVLFKSKHAKELSTFKEENHIEINKKRKKFRKCAKKKENRSTINELNDTSKKRIDVLNLCNSKLCSPLEETTNMLNIQDKDSTCFLKSINKVQKLNNINDQNYSSISIKSGGISYLTKNFDVKPCSVILNKDNTKEWKFMLNKSENIAKEGNSNILNDSVNITYQSPTSSLNIKESLLCSTPITKCKKKLACSILYSPINAVPPIKFITDNTNKNVLDSKTLFTLHACTMNYSNISMNQSQPSDVHAELSVKDSISQEKDTLDHLLSCKNDIQEQKLSHLGIFENNVNFINNRQQYDTIFIDDSIDLVLKQNYNKENQKNNSLLSVLNTSVETNRSCSLFNNGESKLHLLASDDNISGNKQLANTDAQISNNKLKSELSALNTYNDEEIIKLKVLKQNESCELITIMKKESAERSIKKKNEDVEDKYYDELHANQNQCDLNETNAFFAQIRDSVKVTKRRAQDQRRNFKLSHIYENEQDFAQYPLSKISQLNEKIIDYNLNQNPTNNLVNTSTSTVMHYDNENVWINRHTSTPSEKFIFLKPGKFWARSLSILHNFQNGLNLNETSVEKGRKWRYSVQSILDMQKKDLSSSKEENKQQLCSEAQIKSCDELLEEHNTDQSTFSKQCTRRISVRVVRDSKCIQNSDDDILFLEAYGIYTNTKFESTLETNCTANCNTQYNDKGNIHSEICSSKTAREVVLQKCSQTNYLPFDECIPHTYLKHCQKIGEGVYGEVFLYEKDKQKSVLKIIPIEGDQLVNGEPQKKFSEILSEIVIAKELHNLRFNKIHSTSGFVEVKSIKCIKGKYPEEMINLWKNYDNEKTSDNDCPSIFNENQLYITFELGHGGQDLEAFEFNTASEAYTLFLQIALALAVAEKSFEFEHRDLHWGNILISYTDEQYIYYKLDNKDIFLPSNGVKVCIIDYTLSRISYQGCCIFNDLALDPVLFTAQGEYQFEIYRLMRNKIQNNWQEYEPYTNILWLHYILDKMVTIVRYKKKKLKKHKNAIIMLQKLKEVILSYESAFDFVNNCDQITNLTQNISTQ